MTGDILLNWITLAISVINTILLFWLGLTVLLNSEHRSLGVVIAGGGLLLSGLFFLSHTAILGIGLLQDEARLNLWWRTGWIPVVILPFAWYVVMLWYSSYWDDSQSPIHQRHQVPLLLASLLAISTVGLVFLFNALPTYNQLVKLDLGGVLSVDGVPILMLVYPLYLVMCIGFSLDVLLNPGMPKRLMGQLARQRARLWLQIGTISLLLVSLLVGGIIIWGITTSKEEIIISKFVLLISFFDLIIDLLIAITIISIGQAIVSYEIFTGKVLPRQGLKLYWKLAIIFSVGVGIIFSGALIYHLEPTYFLLLSIILLTIVFAILGWRSFTEQDRYIKTLQPLITSQHLYNQLLEPDLAATEEEIDQPFLTLCTDILGVKQAYLVPLGIFASLMGNTISYPANIDSDGNEELLSEIRSAIAKNSGFSPLLLPESNRLGKNPLLISLYSERGLIGALVLGDKQNNSLYTQEEIEISRTVSARLIDNKVSSLLTHKLIDLQKQRISETTLIDQQTRRSLHDEILPRLQSAMINLSTGALEPAIVVKDIGKIHQDLTGIMRALPTVHEPELAHRSLIEALQINIEKDYQSFFSTLTWQVAETALENTRIIPSYAADVLYHATREAVRNAALHGRNSDMDPLINVNIAISWDQRMMIKIQDDGVGFVLITKDHDYDGQGLALHSTLMALVGGSLTIESVPQKYTLVTLKYPA